VSAPRRRLVRNGFALIVVLNIVVVLSSIAIIASQGSREGAAISANFKTDAQQSSLAEATLALAAQRLSAAEPEGRWDPDGRPYRFSLFGQEVVVSIQDESGKISINNTDESTLARAFANSGLAPSQAQDLAAAIADWRDSDDARRLGGAEQSDYAAAGISGSPANAPFTRIDELCEVLGMTQSAYKIILPLVTTNSRATSVNLDVASIPVLKALFGSGSPNISAILARRNTATTAMGEVTNAVGPSRPRAPTERTAAAATYSITAALAVEGRTRVFHGVFRIEQDNLGPRLAIREPMALDQTAPSY
jgi:general secretion pathway protein K